MPGQGQVGGNLAACSDLSATDSTDLCERLRGREPAADVRPRSRQGRRAAGGCSPRPTTQRRKGGRSGNNAFAVRLKQVAGAAGSIAGVLWLSNGASLAPFGPAFSPGATVDGLTWPSYGTQGPHDYSFVDRRPLRRHGSADLGRADDRELHARFRHSRINWGTPWDGFSFTMPSGGTAGHMYSALIDTSAGGAVFTRFVGYPDPAPPYGAQFTYEAPGDASSGADTGVPVCGRRAVGSGWRVGESPISAPSPRSRFTLIGRGRTGKRAENTATSRRCASVPGEARDEIRPIWLAGVRY